MSAKILIVDDEADIRLYLSKALEKEGYETVVAANGMEALEIARNGGIDLVSLDLEMPRQTGTDFYRRISKDKDLKDIPIIVVSGLAGRDVALKEPVAVFDKPIDLDRFIEVVEETVGEG